MEKKQINIEFIPYEQALELKELGFDEPCLSYYEGESFSYHLATMTSGDDYTIPAPIFQQAFRWFREKYGLYHCIIPSKSVHDNYVAGIFYIEVLDSSGKNHAEYDDNEYFYEEAELACLKKLIEIVKSYGKETDRS